MQIDRRKIGEIIILDMEGRLDIPGAALLKQMVREQLEEGSRLFALNFAKVDYIGKETVGAIVSIKSEITGSEGRMVIFAPKWDVKDYIEHFSYKSDIAVLENESGALEMLGAKQAGAEPQGPIYMALGSSSAFKELFWTVKRLGGVPIERYEATEQAISGTGGRSVEVILLDALMPQNEALQAVREIRLKNWGKGAVILVIGPDSSRSLYNAMHDYGADDFVPIPFDREELVSSIDKGQFFQLLKRKFDLWAEGYYDRK
jgi:anti-sigma B factor antagonist